jgi:hypothetical protein
VVNTMPTRAYPYCGNQIIGGKGLGRGDPPA